MRLAVAIALVAAPAFADIPLSKAVASLDTTPCAESSLTCTTLTLPLDHRANDPSETIDITFAMSFAAVESRGILFFFVGGPGGSGLASAEDILADVGEDVTDYIDMVFVDQRGVGPDHGLSCPVARTRFDTTPVSLDAPDAALAAARSFVTDCVTEMDADKLLPVVNTDQAIRDFEAFRQAVGAPKVWLYGESYGTQVVQAYATAYPNAVRGVILDGVVDLTLNAEAFYAYTATAERLLARTFAECMAIAACAKDMGGDPAEVYDTLAKRLSEGPVDLDITLADGSPAQRQLTSAVLEFGVFYALYTTWERADFLRALASAGRGNLTPMLHLGYSAIGVDPETEAAARFPDFFPETFYAVICSDYDSGPGVRPDERAVAIINEARAFGPSAPRLLRWYYVERLVCAYWPYQGPPNRPAPYAGGDWPTLVLNGDADPITPVGMAYLVLDNAANAYGVFMQGGPHVIWGRGFSCPDAIVTELLVAGTLPTAREQHCEEDFLGEYVPLTLTSPAEMADAVTVAQAVRTELNMSLTFSSWDGFSGPFSKGCDYGGTYTATPTEVGLDFTFADCRFWPDLAVTGTGVKTDMGEPSDGITFTLAVTGPVSGDLIYRYRYHDEAWSLAGTWGGKPATLPRLDP